MAYSIVQRIVEPKLKVRKYNEIRVTVKRKGLEFNQSRENFNGDDECDVTTGPVYVGPKLWPV